MQRPRVYIPVSVLLGVVVGTIITAAIVVPLLFERHGHSFDFSQQALTTAGAFILPSVLVWNVYVIGGIVLIYTLPVHHGLMPPARPPKFMLISSIIGGIRIARWALTTLVDRFLIAGTIMDPEADFVWVWLIPFCFVSLGFVVGGCYGAFYSYFRHKALGGNLYSPEKARPYSVGRKTLVCALALTTVFQFALTTSNAIFTKAKT